MPFKKVRMSVLVTALCFLVLLLQSAGLLAEETAVDQDAGDTPVYYTKPITVTAGSEDERGGIVHMVPKTP